MLLVEINHAWVAPLLLLLPPPQHTAATPLATGLWFPLGSNQSITIPLRMEEPIERVEPAIASTIAIVLPVAAQGMELTMMADGCWSKDIITSRSGGRLDELVSGGGGKG